jgi:poly(3-hydroxybutyrate) depolymerase
VQFVSDLTAGLAKDFCIDEDNMFATGASNGAMLLYPLVAELHERSLKAKFRAILPNYGAFFQNMQDVPASLKGTSVFAFHGREDTEVPFQGGESADGWLYTPIHKTLAAYASLNGCEAAAEVITTTFDGRKHLNGCREFKGCNEGRVVRCDFQEAHGFWEPYQEKMIWSFFKSVMSKPGNVTMV